MAEKITSGNSSSLLSVPDEQCWLQMQPFLLLEVQRVHCPGLLVLRALRELLNPFIVLITCVLPAIDYSSLETPDGHVSEQPFSMFNWCLWNHHLNDTRASWNISHLSSGFAMVLFCHVARHTVCVCKQSGMHVRPTVNDSDSRHVQG